MHQNMIVRLVMPFESIMVVAIILPLALGPSRQQWVELVLVMIVCGLAFPYWIMTLKLTTVVTDRRLWARFWVIPARDVPLETITSVESIKYSPIGDAGGWGVRGSRKFYRVYNVSGDRGVHVRFGEGKRDHFLVGSRRPDELAEAIELGRFAATS